METFQHILLKAHSGLRWVVLALVLYAIVNAFAKMRDKKFSPTDKLLSIMALSFTHIQVVLGLALYFITGKYLLFGQLSDPTSRLYALEHPLTMILGAVLITIGHSKAKKKTNDKGKFRTIGLFFLVGLILILSRIPW